MWTLVDFVVCCTDTIFRTQRSICFNCQEGPYSWIISRHAPHLQELPQVEENFSFYSLSGEAVFIDSLIWRVQRPGLLPQSGTSLKNMPGLDSPWAWLRPLFHLHHSSASLSAQSCSLLSCGWQNNGLSEMGTSAPHTCKHVT